MKLSWAAVERWVWYAFIATFAWQTRFIFWQADPTFIEWRSASLYLSDVLMLVLFALAYIQRVARDGISEAVGWGSGPRRYYPERWLLGLLLIFSAISLFNAGALSVGVYAFLRLAQFVIFFLYLRSWALKRFDADYTAIAFVLGALAQAALGIAQYLLQHDVGLRIFGETLLNTHMRGVAVFYNVGHELILRAYGTLPHPNVLAAYLMAALGVLGWLWLRHGDPRQRWWWAWPSATAVLVWAFYLTFSRTIIAVWAAAVLILFCAIMIRRISKRWPAVRTLRRRMVPMAITIAVTSLAFVVLLWPQVSARLALSASDESVQLRLDYARDSLSSGGGFLHVNWFGVGIGNFTTWLADTQPHVPAYYIQPAHNLFLLIYSEVGLLGLLALLGFLISIFRLCWHAYATQPALRLGLMLFLAAYCAIALFDHFFWTLQQGRILWWLTLALAAGVGSGTIHSHGRSH